MLESLTISNFQTHRKLEVALDPRVSTIIGRNDVGKSTILRALRWVCLNRAPPNFIHWDAESARVQLMVDGHKIVRKRGKENVYFLDGVKLKAFSSAVPDVVAKVLNLDVVNFSGQHDAAFWFSQSPGQVAKNLNQIVNLEVIDNVLERIASRLYAAKTKVDVCSTRLQSAEATAAELSWVKKMLPRFNQIDEQAKANKRKAKERDGLAVLVDKLTTANHTVRTLAPRVERAEEILQAGQAYEEKRQQMWKLQKLIEALEFQETNLCQLKEKLSQAKKRLASFPICPTCERPMERS